MMRRALLLLACVGGAAAIHSVTLDKSGVVAATAALAAGDGADGVGVIQGVNLPYVLSTEITLKKGDSANSMGAYWRTTKETSFKAYVKCAGLSSSSSTYSLSYTLDGSASATVGTDFTSTSNPFVMVESLDDGMHTLIVTCTVRRPLARGSAKTQKNRPGAGFAARRARMRTRRRHDARVQLGHQPSPFLALIIIPPRLLRRIRAATTSCTR
jgi:hypothetical protein